MRKFLNDSDMIYCINRVKVVLKKENCCVMIVPGDAIYACNITLERLIRKGSSFQFYTISSDLGYFMSKLAASLFNFHW